MFEGNGIGAEKSQSGSPFSSWRTSGSEVSSGHGPPGRHCLRLFVDPLTSTPSNGSSQMLPSPALTRLHRTTRSHPHRSIVRDLLNVLLTRSRVTNLGLIILSSLTAFSLLLNLVHYIENTSPSHTSLGTDTLAYQLSDENDDSQNVIRESWAEPLDHLIVVPGHAIWKGADPEKRTQDSEWTLEPYQKGSGRTRVFWEHIVTG